ncbi:hypothetical protein RND71_028299 [Anisodus tanguticus]|uniref:TMEM205-like domain-containing protein n=1 Tax=Anisodus tanguticus TaxID=243964 RepID=A0AAE1V6Z8_9SOLA|nr:hypothetical protein RND71_028299 [Anisodus tanguticus]
MMNILAISLVLSTLVTAGFFNPNTQNNNNNNNKKKDVVLVVEFDKDDVTKVLISPQDQAEIPSKGKSKSGYVTNLKDKLYEKAEEASSVLPNIGQGISSPYVNKHQEDGHEYHTKASARDVVCDAFGKCREKIASALGKTKDKVSEKAHEAADQVDEVKESAKGTTEKVEDKVEEIKEKAKDVVDTTKRKKVEVEQDASRKIEHTKGEISEKAKELEEKAQQVKDSVKESARKVKEEGKKDLKDILERGREFFYDVFMYIFSFDNLRPVMRLAHLLGFAVAYGMCIWVTFVSSYVLARVLPRQQFAVVQSKIYPVYFKAMAYCVGAAFLGHLLSQKRRAYASSAEAVQGFNLLASIAILLVNLLYLEPRASKVHGIPIGLTGMTVSPSESVMFERLKLEKEEGRGRTDIFNVEPSGRGVDSVLDPTGTKITSHTTTSKVPAEKSPEEVTSVVKPQVVRLSQKLKKINTHSSFLNVLTLMSLSHHLIHLTQLLDVTS